MTPLVPDASTAIEPVIRGCRIAPCQTNSFRAEELPYGTLAWLACESCGSYAKMKGPCANLPHPTAHRGNGGCRARHGRCQRTFVRGCHYGRTVLDNGSRFEPPVGRRAQRALCRFCHDSGAWHRLRQKTTSRRGKQCDGVKDTLGNGRRPAVRHHSQLWTAGCANLSHKPRERFGGKGPPSQYEQRGGATPLPPVRRAIPIPDWKCDQNFRHTTKSLPRGRHQVELSCSQLSHRPLRNHGRLRAGTQADVGKTRGCTSKHSADRFTRRNREVTVQGRASSRLQLAACQHLQAIGHGANITKKAVRGPYHRVTDCPLFRQ